MDASSSSSATAAPLNQPSSSETKVDHSGNSSASPTLLDLPTELLLHIASFVRVPQLLGATCHRLRAVVANLPPTNITFAETVASLALAEYFHPQHCVGRAVAAALHGGPPVRIKVLEQHEINSLASLDDYDSDDEDGYDYGDIELPSSKHHEWKKELQSLATLDDDVGVVAAVALSHGELRRRIKNDRDIPPELLQLSSRIGDLTALTYMDLHDCWWEDLPQSIGNLTALTSLELSNTRFTELPESIGNLTALKHLKCDKFQFELPASLSNLTALTEVHISTPRYPGTHDYPSAFSSLTALKTLVFSYCFCQTIPASIGNLTALTTLDLRQNRLTALPDSIGNLTALVNLDLSLNELTTLPESIGNLTALVVLNLFQNHLTALPESCRNLTALTALDIHDNIFDKFPEWTDRILSNLMSEEF